METLQSAVPDDVRNLLRHAAQTFRTHVGPGQLTSEHLGDAVATLVHEFCLDVSPEPLSADADNGAPNPPGINLSVTRAVLGTLLRIAADLDIIKSKSAADLCRRIAPGISTLGLARLPAESLLRAFRNPTAAAYRKVQELCAKVIEYIKVNRLAE
jgi:hypothetical protein